MATTQINQLPEGVAHPDAILAADNPPRTRTEKIRLGDVAALGGGPPGLHASSHAQSGDDPVTPASIGAAEAVHTHTVSDIVDFETAAVSSVNSRTGDVVLTKSDVGLDQVDNTADVDKPISDDTQDALDLKSDIGHTHTASEITDFTIAVQSVVKTFENIDSDVSVTSLKDFIFIDTTAAPVEITLPSAVINAGKQVKVKRAEGLNEATVFAEGLELIDGQSSFTMYSKYEAITLISNGVNWFIV